MARRIWRGNWNWSRPKVPGLPEFRNGPAHAARLPVRQAAAAEHLVRMGGAAMQKNLQLCRPILRSIAQITDLSVHCTGIG